MADLFKVALEKALSEHVWEPNISFIPMQKLDHRRVWYQETTILGVKVGYEISGVDKTGQFLEYCIL